MKWSEKTWLAAKPVYDKILELPFIQELMNGTLANEKFIFYIRQDAVYLAEYGRVLTGIASRLASIKHISAFLNFASESIIVEQALHESFVHELSSDKTEATPSCLLYTSYLQKQLAGAPLEVALASVLPCFWIYKEVGDYILENQAKGNNPYQSWIDTYGGEGFSESVSLAISICDEVAEQCTGAQQQAMTEAYLMCSKFEWMFWESAYRQEEWKI
ncbi:TenA family protein [Dysgonomonas macrotermitis]|uniref:Thiaminase (Transcriptional activator TenA) n=1 Tax=Dysgonomonas macrotermitis TaxID=1346286 RepID=A0A1M4TFP9_9BACT|nr:TenA family protein [Dysgonomonas macrotermitis]SHE43117.1 thiaminase (transcriptional activator TenA) [Dysgonomonas macrotermitis]